MFQKAVELFFRGALIAALGTLILEVFAIVYGIVLGLMPDPPYNQVPARIAYGVFVACIAYSPVGLVLFFLVGISTRQHPRVVLERCARNLATIACVFTLLATLVGAIHGHLNIPTDTTFSPSKPGWVSGASSALLLAFPVGVLIALIYSVVSLRREQ